jgi:HK97 family phage portal protein
MNFWSSTKKNFINVFEKPKPYFYLNNDYMYMNAYKTNPIVFRAVSTYVKHINTIDLDNKPANWHRIITSIVQNLLITGNVFVDKNLEVLTINSYNNCHNKQYKSSLLHLKLNTDEHGVGFSPIFVSKRAIEAHEEVSKFIMGIIQNGGKPSGILSHKDVYETTGSVERKLQELYDHINKVGSFALLEGDYEWKQIGISPEKLELLAHKSQCEREIAIAFDIPPVLLGIVESTYNNYAESRRHFLENSVMPILQYIIYELNIYLEFNIKIKENLES